MKTQNDEDATPGSKKCVVLVRGMNIETTSHACLEFLRRCKNKVTGIAFKMNHMSVPPTRYFFGN